MILRNKTLLSSLAWWLKKDTVPCANVIRNTSPRQNASLMSTLNKTLGNWKAFKDDIKTLKFGSSWVWLQMVGTLIYGMILGREINHHVRMSWIPSSMRRKQDGWATKHRGILKKSIEIPKNSLDLILSISEMLQMVTHIEKFGTILLRDIILMS